MVGVFNQPSENWPLAPAIQFASAQVRELPLLNSDIDFITEGYLNQEIDLEKITTGSNLIRFADQPPRLTPPFWKLFSRYRSFKTSLNYLISLCVVLATRFPKYYPQLVGKSRLDLEDLVIEKILRGEQPCSQKVADLVMKSQTDYVIRKIDGILFVQGRREELPGPGETIPLPARLTRLTGCYLVPLLSRISPIAKAVARMFHDKFHTSSPQFIGREIRTQYYINRLTPYLKQIARNCFFCRKLNQELVKVERGMLPSFRRSACSPNLVLACDMVGPYEAKRVGMNTRGAATQKVWLLFAANTYTRQVFATGLDSQSIEDLLLGFSELFIHTGKPSIITTDAGSNFNAFARRYTDKQLVPPKKKEVKEGRGREKGMRRS